MSTELAEPVPVPATPSAEETPLHGGGSGAPGSVSPLQAGLPLGCPGSQADPTTLVRGQMDVMPDVEYRSDPLQSPSPHAARAAAAAGAAIATAKAVAEVAQAVSSTQPPRVCFRCTRRRLRLKILHLLIFRDVKLQYLIKLTQVYQYQ